MNSLKFYPLIYSFLSIYVILLYILCDFDKSINLVILILWSCPTTKVGFIIREIMMIGQAIQIIFRLGIVP